MIDGTPGAIGIARCAEGAPVQNHLVAKTCHVFIGHDFHECKFHLGGIGFLGQPKTAGEASRMGVDDQSVLTEHIPQH